MAGVPHVPTENSPSIPAVFTFPKNQSTSGSQRAAAFTLVEIMIAVVIIGLLAAMAIPAFQRVRQRSQASRMANDFKQFESAFQRFALESGSWPPFSAAGTIPTGMNGYLPAAYQEVSPLGGRYLWTGPSQHIVLLGTQATDPIMQMVDAALDDGVLTTGDFRKIGGNNFGYWAH